jgi:hypothetical protein
LSVILAIALIYILTTQIEKKTNWIYEEGVNYGYQYAIYDIYAKVSECQQVPIYMNTNTTNSTLNLVAVECYSN